VSACLTEHSVFLTIYSYLFLRILDGDQDTPPTSQGFARCREEFCGFVALEIHVGRFHGPIFALFTPI